MDNGDSRKRAREDEPASQEFKYLVFLNTEESWGMRIWGIRDELTPDRNQAPLLLSFEGVSALPFGVVVSGVGVAPAPAVAPAFVVAALPMTAS